MIRRRFGVERRPCQDGASGRLIDGAGGLKVTFGSPRPPPPLAAAAGPGRIHLRLLETTDVHVAIHPYDYYADAPSDTCGLARTAALIETARAEAVNTLLFDNGDFLQGNPMGDYVAYERGVPNGTLHPAIAAMNVLGYDVAALGNHEFNYGLDLVNASLAGAGFPLVCANLVRGTQLGIDPTRDPTFAPPFVILERRLVDGADASHVVRIGCIGFLPPQVVTWDRHHLAGKVVTRDIVATARAYAPQMREAGADLVVALAHTGIDPDRSTRASRTPRCSLPPCRGSTWCSPATSISCFRGRTFPASPASTRWRARCTASPR
ncbi:2',3'-cyclic-nucleotide 2'-phosphodiesterase/3'-nucleotidase precursor [Methylobrevis pamukkalensis]|uniref:2',3'-cyclic-nucleotide 2'-phosphodiesterase/3'-nucleotidase n=1 Tax=Methylobrevis pamukkalensis TaxID=1439726 RepID=A0A1E3H2N2_9HYPH|nr:hypothetical protein [Methylobrevis pamukkalensis]ODN70572.1 2',3'-cyclic-nucleotide 2'-phosphodiesterase/3'-nucleotidase precursor [Methylobrevis pamukkalensis]